MPQSNYEHARSVGYDDRKDHWNRNPGFPKESDIKRRGVRFPNIATGILAATQYLLGDASDLLKEDHLVLRQNIAGSSERLLSLN